MLFLNKTPTLSDTELAIYQYITTHLDSVQYMRIRDLADATFTSTATILRFCSKFECQGYAEFRVKLQLYIKNQQPSLPNVVDETVYIHFIQRTTEPLYQEKIQAATSLLKEKELVLFLGHGSSNIMAEYGALYFSSLFTMALRVEDPANYPMHFLSKSIAKKMCIIALSVSGETIEIINYLNHFQASECSIISITNSAKSSIAKLSNVNIPYYISQESYEGADVTSQVPALYTIEYLAKEVQRNRK